MRTRPFLMFALVAAATFSLPIASFAHHSFAAEYDSNKPIKFSGKVTKVEWLNPHIYVYVDAKDQAGKNVNYAVEGGAPNGLFRQGWRKDIDAKRDAACVTMPARKPILSLLLPRHVPVIDQINPRHDVHHFAFLDGHAKWIKAGRFYTSPVDPAVLNMFDWRNPRPTIRGAELTFRCP